MPPRDSPYTATWHQTDGVNGYAALLCAIVQQALRDAQGRGIHASNNSARVQVDAQRWCQGACGPCRDEVLALLEDATGVVVTPAGLAQALARPRQRR
jgi:hypothetical protein